MKKPVFNPPASAASKQDTRWPKGVSGNPAGRAKGSRHRALIALDQIGQVAATGLLRTVIREAMAGDMQAARILMDRLWPAPRGRHVRLALLPINSAADLAKALSQTVVAVAAGEITPEEASTIATVMETTRRAFELGAIEDRIKALEDSNATNSRPPHEPP